MLFEHLSFMEKISTLMSFTLSFIKPIINIR